MLSMDLMQKEPEQNVSTQKTTGDTAEMVEKVRRRRKYWGGRNVSHYQYFCKSLFLKCLLLKKTNKPNNNKKTHQPPPPKQTQAD